MTRPEGLALTAWLMVALSILGWAVVDWNRFSKPPYHHSFLVLFIVAVVAYKAFGLICTWYYYQGRNWARIAVLIASVWTLYNLRLVNHGNILYRGVVAADGVFGLCLLYWLNTPELRRYFTAEQT